MFMMENSNVNNLVSPYTTILHKYRGATVISHHETRIIRSLQDPANLCSGYKLKTNDLLLYIIQLLLHQGTLVSGVSSISNVNSFNNMHLAIELNCQCVQNKTSTNENTGQAAQLLGNSSISNTDSFNNMDLKLNFTESGRNHINYINYETSSISNVNQFNNIHLSKEYSLRTCSLEKKTHSSRLTELNEELLKGVSSISNNNSFNNMNITIHVKCPCKDNVVTNKEFTEQNEILSELISSIVPMKNVNSFKNPNFRMRFDCRC